MDRVAKLICLALAVFLPFSAFSATYYTGGGFNFLTAVDACKAAFANNGSFVYGSTSGLNCLDKDGRTMFTINQANCSGVLVKNTGTGYTCSASCPSGQVNIAGVCKVKPTCVAGTTYDAATNTCPCDSGYEVGGQMVAGDVFTACKGGCKLLLYSGWYDKTQNLTWGYDWKQTGSSCTVSDAAVKSPTDPAVQDAKRCPVGQCPGTLNGASICVPCESPKQTDKTSSTETTSETPSGASSPVSTSTKTETSDTRTSCTGDQCTTQRDITTTNPDGSKTTKTESKTEPKSDYCTDNPKAPVCKGDEGSWGGTCAGGFQCEGSAVECAIAQASWKSACATEIDPTDSKVTTGNAAMSAGDRPGDHPANSPATSAFSANLDQTNPYGSECPADMPLDVMGQSFSIPLSHACGSFRFMGQIVVAFSLFAAAFIVFGGIKG